jgi:hypothetical protein
MFPMVWGSYLRCLHPCNNNSSKWFKSPIVVGSELSKKQLDKSKCISKVMFMRNFGMNNRFWQFCNCKIVKPTRCCMDSGSCFMWELMWSHLNWLKCCSKQHSMNAALALSMTSIHNLFILWTFDATTCCGSTRFPGNQISWIFEVT